MNSGLYTRGCYRLLLHIPQVASKSLTTAPPSTGDFFINFLAYLSRKPALVLTLQIFGASYGLLFAIKALLAGHQVRVVCTEAEAELISGEGIQVTFPQVGRAGPTVLRSQDLPGRLIATLPDKADLAGVDLAVLAMQEPQYRAPEIHQLLHAVAAAETPCVSIMNLPPLAFLKRFEQIDTTNCASAYTNADLWAEFNPNCITHCSADPQAVRPNSDASNTLKVNLPTNFRAAPFADISHTNTLQILADTIKGASLAGAVAASPTPVRLKVAASPFMGLSKLPMLITGNYRCLHKDGLRSIKDAVHTDLHLSRSIYESVCAGLQRLGSPHNTLVPFEQYAAAACALEAPSSAAQALARGVPAIERVDRLVQLLLQQKQRPLPELDNIVAQVDNRLSANRATAA